MKIITVCGSLKYKEEIMKITEEKVLDLIDNKEYFKAYHMNKKYWYTITLTKNINMKKLEKLIDESYNLVEKKKS